MSPCSSQNPLHPALLPHLTLMPPTPITVTYLWGLGLCIFLHLDYPSALRPPPKSHKLLLSVQDSTQGAPGCLSQESVGLLVSGSLSLSLLLGGEIT